MDKPLLVGTVVTLIGQTLAPQWRGKRARVIELYAANPYMLTVETLESRQKLLVFTKEVERCSAVPNDI